MSNSHDKDISAPIFDDSDVLDAAIVGAVWFKHGLLDQKEWAAKVVEFFGPNARDYLADIWDAALVEYEPQQEIASLPEWSDESLPPIGEASKDQINEATTGGNAESKDHSSSSRSPLPGVDPAQEEKELEQLIVEAHQFARGWIKQKQGSASEFITALVEQFGSPIKIIIIDLVTRLREDNTIINIQREYIETALSVEEIQQALQGKPQSHALKENTLDELFARSSAFRSSTKFVEAINFVSKLRVYAPYNNMLVYLQRPTATFWATASHWRRQYGRSIKDDAIPLIMLQPMGPIMLAYDMEDTEGAPLPKQFTDPFAVEGNFDDGILNMTLENCGRVNIAIKDKKLGTLHAGTAILAQHKDSLTITIEINQKLDSPARYATLCHELAHIYLGHLGGDPDGTWPSRLGLSHNQRELEAEAVAYMVCFRANLTTTSDEYLASYLSNPNELAGISIDLIMKVAGHIERMGKEVVRPRKKKDSKKNS
jgi:hypothetical protein